MAVPEQTPYIEHIGNGVTTSFSLGFQCESKDHLIVLVDEIEPPIATWSLNNGNVVFTTAPAAGKKITVQRNTPFGRTANYQSFNNSFRPQTVNIDFDRIWWKLQELGVADWLMKLYVDRLHQQQEQKINDLKGYVDDRDDELRAYLMEEIRKQGVALDQLDEYYNYLMQRLAQIAVDKGWDASFVVYNGKTLQEFNDRISKQRFSVKAYGAVGSVAGAEVDDGDAIIAAIQACSDAGGGEVFFDPLPNGGYYASTLRSQLTNINNVKINGNKQKLYTIDPEITVNGNRSPFYINIGDNIEVFGFYFDGRYEDYVSKSKRINSHNFAGGFLSNVKIYHNVFANCGYPNDTIDEAGDSLYITRNSHDIDIFENIFINPARWSVSFQYNTDDLGGISIRNNFQYITRPNKSLGFIDLEFSSSALATQVSDILIEDNTAYFSPYIAMSNSSFKDVTIRNNKLKGYTYGANRVYKSTDYPYGFGLLLAPDTGRLPLENIEILDNTFDSVNKANLEVKFASKGLKVKGNKFYTQPDAPASCGFSKGIAIINAIDVEVSGNSILGTANQPSSISLSVTNSTGSVYGNVAKHAVATAQTAFSSAAGGELCVYDNYLETQNSTYQFVLFGDGVLFWGNTTPVGTSGRISPSAVIKFYGKNNTRLNGNYNAQITNKFFAGQGDLSIAYASAVPDTGTWKVGDIVYNTNPSSGGVLGWSCVTSGTPGTWMPFGVLGVQKLTTANLQSATHAANTTNKFAGKSVINSTDKKLYYADGSAPTDVWLSVDGATTINPVA